MNIINLLFLFSFIYSQNWEMIITAQDIGQSGSSDYVILEMCEGCHDGFHFGEDEYDLPTPPDYYTDISFTNFEWVGTFDDNGNQCQNPEFYIDKKSYREPVDLTEWNIGGFANLINNSTQIKLTWEFEEISNEYEIYIYIDTIGHNMRLQDELIINQEDLTVNYNQETNNFNSNIKILLGGCASEGTNTYYYDNDNDGHGGNSESPQEFCTGFQPQNWVNNNNDIDDDFYCVENVIDSCSVCNGANECLDCNNEPWGTAQIDNCGICSGGNTNHIANDDMDCNNDCFGVAILDDCGICSGGNTNHIANDDMDCLGICYGIAEIDDCGICNDFNQSCLEDFFLNGPIDLYAYINDGIELRWDQPNYPENNIILGFNIYRNGAYLLSTIEEEYYFNEFTDGEFCVSAFDQYNNESEINCTTATDLQQFCWVLDHGLNLISYPILPLDISVSNIFSTIEEYIVGIISEGDAASLLPNGVWVGSLVEIENNRGYWVKLDLGDPFANQEYCITGYPIPNTLEYNLSEGANLISYLGENNNLISDALNEYNNNFTAIIGEASAAYNNPMSSWVGSLITLNEGSGYWVIVNENFIFQWENSP